MVEKLTKSTCPHLLSIEWYSIRLDRPAHVLVPKTVHKTLPEVGGPGGGDVTLLVGISDSVIDIIRMGVPFDKHVAKTFTVSF